MSSIKIGDIEIHESENGLYLITDLWKASGALKKDEPNRFMKLKSTAEMVEFINSEAGTKTGVSLNSTAYEIIEGSPEFGGGTYVCKKLAYIYGMWISPKFYSMVIDTFESVINSESIEELIAARDYALGELAVMEMRQPNDKQSLPSILGIARAKCKPYFDYLVSIGELTKHEIPVKSRVVYKATTESKSVIGQKGSTVLFNNTVKSMFPETVDMTSLFA